MDVLSDRNRGFVGISLGQKLEYTLQCHQTYGQLAGIPRTFLDIKRGRKTSEWWIFRQAMFDDQRISKQIRPRKGSQPNSLSRLIPYGREGNPYKR